MAHMHTAVHRDGCEKKLILCVVQSTNATSQLATCDITYISVWPETRFLVKMAWFTTRNVTFWPTKPSVVWGLVGGDSFLVSRLVAFRVLLVVYFFSSMPPLEVFSSHSSPVRGSKSRWCTNVALHFLNSRNVAVNWWSSRHSWVREPFLLCKCGRERK